MIVAGSVSATYTEKVKGEGDEVVTEVVCQFRTFSKFFFQKAQKRLEIYTYALATSVEG